MLAQAQAPTAPAADASSSAAATSGTATTAPAPAPTPAPNPMAMMAGMMPMMAGRGMGGVMPFMPNMMAQMMGIQVPGVAQTATPAAAQPAPAPAAPEVILPPPKDYPPNQTLYVHNISTKIKIDDLKSNLHDVFKSYGKIREIIAMKSLRRRGQAWVTFNSIEEATKAKEAVHGFPFRNKPLQIEFSKSKSDLIAKEEGTFVPRAKKPLPPKEVKPKAQAGAGEVKVNGVVKMENGVVVKKEPVDEDMDMAKEDKAKGPSPGGKRPADGSPTAAAAPKTSRPFFQPTPQVAPVAPAAPQFNVVMPNNMLFVENLPEDCTDTMLTAIFAQFGGFQEVRLIAGRRVAFVDYDTEVQATFAMNGLQGKELNGLSMKISYARR
ncbi:unnamed protein product [Vitrella brassicaformis CCMP3155]|uniref:RRM domain-containing protein n=1 Tax=Vitrella brassicaformis (strain CCMP3155) TaxID=1169540 RepID=A0A0G4EBY6_VITBC|nr:unnamed protein product [Vitrella brassicaformis CCMP3155]|eukprot:CEL93181.1 unnamed protein product [Vitrella brassicaformis CCMP3155]